MVSVNSLKILSSFEKKEEVCSENKRGLQLPPVMMVKEPVDDSSKEREFFNFINS